MISVGTSTYNITEKREKNFGSFNTTLIPHENHPTFINAYNEIYKDLKTGMLSPRTQLEIDAFRDWSEESFVYLPRKRFWIRKTRIMESESH